MTATAAVTCVLIARRVAETCEVRYRTALPRVRLSKAVPYSVVMLYGKTDVTLWRNGGSVNLKLNDGRIP